MPLYCRVPGRGFATQYVSGCVVRCCPSFSSPADGSGLHCMEIPPQVSCAMSIGRWFGLSSSAMVILLGMAAYYPAIVNAGRGFQPVSPEESQMTSEPLAPGAPAIILYRQVDRDDNGHTSHQDNYFRIKILTEDGRKYADIEIPFFKASEDVVNVHARTIRPDGSIANFDGKVFEKSLAKAKGMKFLAKTFTLSDVQVASIIENYYTMDLKYVYDSHWILSEDLFTKSAS